ncbi:MAG: hypothetical protein ACRDTE_01000 [Pseudonocardiaceae bacterium]
MLFDLPFKGEDLKPGERYDRRKKTHGGGSQALGYDLRARRWDAKNNSWTVYLAGKDTATNESWVVYGKPVYAMADGIVVKGWRNAPENPGPGEEHPELGKGIGGGGNHLVVELDDGGLILYAHMIPGTIPSKLVPHEAELLPNNDPEQRDIPPDQQEKVKAGQFLGLVGNSGSSSNPHLHIHHVKDGDAADLKFRRGLATKLTGKNEDQADINSWVRFAGERIPPGPTLIWPPRSVGSEYTRHAFPADDFERMFDHLADSGYWPKWIDGYSVGGRAFFNFVFTEAPGPWRGFFGQTAANYQRRFDEAKRDGFQPVFVESYLSSDNVRYIAVFQKDRPGRFLARHGLTTGQHEAELDNAKKAGLNPDCVSVVSVQGQRRYTVLYRSDSIGHWQVKSRVQESDYQEIFNENKAAGRSPVYLQAYIHDGQEFLSTIFASGSTGAFRARHGLSSADFQQEWTAATTAGFITQVVTSFDGATRSHRFAAVWRKK